MCACDMHNCKFTIMHVTCTWVQLYPWYRRNTRAEQRFLIFASLGINCVSCVHLQTQTRNNYPRPYKNVSRAGYEPATRSVAIDCSTIEPNCPQNVTSRNFNRQSNERIHVVPLHLTLSAVFQVVYLHNSSHQPNTRLSQRKPVIC